MALSLFAAFWIVSALFIITPGADWAYVISAGIRGQAVMPAIAGLLSGHLLATLVVAAGVGALVAGMPAALTGLTVAGAVYLLWLGVGMLRQHATPGVADNVQEMGSAWRWAVKGLCVSGLNPKVFLLFLALMPQFTDPASAWPVSVQIAALGGLHIVTCAAVYTLVGIGSRAVLQARPQAAKRVSQVSGALMVLIAALLLAEAFWK